MKKSLIIFMILLTSCSYKNDNTEKSEKTKTESIQYTVTEQVVGEASTEIIDNGENRVSNIIIACEKISGMTLHPGEEFSFNKITGQKNTANGYKNAPVIVDGEKSYGIGGGVCQVSTTIYMAAINAGLQITEHYNHSEPVAYAPTGMDATVVYGVKDFKFSNNTDDDIYIYVWVKEKKVFAKIIVIKELG